MDPTLPSQTPEFLCWAIEWQCPLRELLPAHDPEKVERQLRAARAVADARAEGRVRDGLAVSADGALGFRIADALALYGGEARVGECCGACPANARAAHVVPSYAGCYGLLPLPEPREEFLARTLKFPRAHELFPPTTWPWYGWWAQSPLGHPQIEYLQQTIGELARCAEFANHQALQELAAALATCKARQLTMSAQLFPSGAIQERWWLLDPHCGHCRAPWKMNGNHCAMCGQTQHPAAAKKRRVRGTRPYRSIEEVT